MARADGSDKPDRRQEIAEAARSVLIREGAGGFTLRAVADQVGIKLASLQYHAPSKAELLHLMTTDSVARYRAVLEGYISNPNADPRTTLREALEWLLGPESDWNDIARFEVQLWALADIDAAASDALDDYMDLYRDFLAVLIARLRPELSEKQLALRAAVVASLIEGSVLLIGPTRPHRPELTDLRPELVEAAMGIVERM